MWLKFGVPAIGRAPRSCVEEPAARHAPARGDLHDGLSLSMRDAVAREEAAASISASRYSGFVVVEAIESPPAPCTWCPTVKPQVPQRVEQRLDDALFGAADRRRRRR